MSTSAFYLEIVMSQRPFLIGADEKNRSMLSFNLTARARAPVDEWEEQLVKLMVDAGLAAFGTDTFVGRTFALPEGNGPFVDVTSTGGLPPELTHDGLTYERLSAQVVTRALDYRVARTRALAIWRALGGRYNQSLSSM